MIVQLNFSTYGRSISFSGFRYEGEYYFANLLEKILPDLTQAKVLKLGKERKKYIESRVGPMKSGETFIFDVIDGKIID